MSFSIVISIGLLVTSIDAGTLKGHVKYDGKAPKKKSTSKKTTKKRTTKKKSS